MHAILIAGAALVGLPILLHLIMKQEPRRLPFPAFRFLKQKHQTNQRKLRLQQFLLLALRMLLIALFCAALYQPTVRSDSFHLRAEQPVAVVLVIDTSPSMGYTSADRTRLDEVRRRALELIDELPERSAIAVVPTGLPPGTDTRFAAQAGTWLRSAADARKLVEALKEPCGGQPVTSAIAQAYQLLKTVEQEAETTETLPKLVAVFTDRTAASWDGTRVDDLKKLRDAFPPDQRPRHTVFDLGVDDPANVALLGAELKPQVVPGNQPVVVTVVIGATGPQAEVAVKAHLDGEAVPGVKAATVPGGSAVPVRFEFTNLKPGLHQARFELEAKDPLAFDNTRFLTFRVAEPRHVLTIADDPDEAGFWKLALDVVGEFAAEVVRPEQVKADTLAKYEAVCLFGVARPNDPAGDPLWPKLRKYVEGGGKLIVIPGADGRMELDQYDPTKVEAANVLLPAAFEKVVNTRDDQKPPADPKAEPDRRDGVTLVLDDAAIGHPLLAPLRAWRQKPDVDFFKYPRHAWKYWQVAPRTETGQVQVVARYDDSPDPAKRRPAVLERTVGKPGQANPGRVLLLTTRLHVETPGVDPEWNDYVRVDNSWSFVFPDLLLKYLAGSTADANFNHLAGQPVSIPLPKGLSGPRGNLVLDGPGVVGDDAILKPDEKQTALRLGVPKALAAGNFLVTLPGADAAAPPRWQDGFSVNVSAEESQLDKVPADAIEDLTGPNSVVPVGKDVKLKDVISGTGAAVDLFPWLLLAVLAAFVAEGLLANGKFKQLARRLRK
jgi:hypothetical protein